MKDLIIGLLILFIVAILIAIGLGYYHSTLIWL